MNTIIKQFSVVILIILLSTPAYSQESIARVWNEVLLTSIRKDFARPTVHARNLFHTSVAMYDIWAIYNDEAEPFCMGKTVGGYEFILDDFTSTKTKEESIDEAISYAMYRLLIQRFRNSPNRTELYQLYNQTMSDLGYNPSIGSNNYTSGNPAFLGNYVGRQLITFGLSDGSNENGLYNNRSYKPVNPPLVIGSEGNPNITDKNRWQPLAFSVFIDQSGNQIPGNIPSFLGPEWGAVVPFSLKEEDLRKETRDNFEYYIYHDPGPPPMITSDTDPTVNDDYLWGNSLVAVWSSHLDKDDDTIIDISPSTIGNITDFPTDLDGLKTFYDFLEGGDPSPGYDTNPKTGIAYPSQLVNRGDYARVLAEFWADGPDSETPPGHWFTLLNYVSDQPQLLKRFNGKGPVMSDLEWDVKSYLLLGGAMHDVAVTVWGLKGYYDYIRPVSAIRAMAEAGQSSDPTLTSYNPQGFPLIPGYIELIQDGDPLEGTAKEFLGEVKLMAWRGPDFIANPDTDEAGVGWIRAKNWWPYQRPTFVTPPFAGYVSGHSTFSRAAAEILTSLTGDPYFPGGVGEFIAKKDEFLVFEEGPSEDVVLQWAKYYDASDQCSLSRIWGGIHPPCDDVPGRIIGIEIGKDAFEFAKSYFYKDSDNDGYFSFEDCDDQNPDIYPGASEICNGIDTDCNGIIDDGLTITTYYRDADNDGFGDEAITLDTCLSFPPAGYVDNAEDCLDNDSSIAPTSQEVCDGIDNDCNGLIDDGLPLISYYLDADNDGFGDVSIPIDTCITFAPLGYVANAQDCNDADNLINPTVIEICDGIDNDCKGGIDDGLTQYTYYLDNDQDGFGDVNHPKDTCITIPPINYVDNAEDCNDSDENSYPGSEDIPDNGVDENCDGIDLFIAHKIFPSIVEETVTIHYNNNFSDVSLLIFNNLGQLVYEEKTAFNQNYEVVNLSHLHPGIYYISLTDQEKKITLINNTFLKL